MLFTPPKKGCFLGCFLVIFGVFSYAELRGAIFGFLGVKKGFFGVFGGIYRGFLTPKKGILGVILGWSL